MVDNVNPGWWIVVVPPRFYMNKQQQKYPCDTNFVLLPIGLAEGCAKPYSWQHQYLSNPIGVWPQFLKVKKWCHPICICTLWKLWHSYCKLPFVVYIKWVVPLKMMIFYGYGELPEGIYTYVHAYTYHISKVIFWFLLSLHASYV